MAEWRVGIWLHGRRHDYLLNAYDSEATARAKAQALALELRSSTVAPYQVWVKHPDGHKEQVICP